LHPSEISRQLHSIHSAYQAVCNLGQAFQLRILPNQLCTPRNMELPVTLLVNKPTSNQSSEVLPSCSNQLRHLLILLDNILLGIIRHLVLEEPSPLNLCSLDPKISMSSLRTLQGRTWMPKFSHNHCISSDIRDNYLGLFPALRASRICLGSLHLELIITSTLTTHYKCFHRVSRPPNSNIYQTLCQILLSLKLW